ncbi:hypothetical protein [Microbacterium lacticum]
MLSITPIVRSVGFNNGSALAGLLFAIATLAVALLPGDHGHTVAGLYAILQFAQANSSSAIVSVTCGSVSPYRSTQGLLTSRSRTSSPPTAASELHAGHST